MIEQMITEAVLRDKFTPVLRKIAGEQDAYARRTNAINAAGNVALGLGAGATAFLAKSVQVAGQVDYIRKALTAVEGANQAAFNIAYVDKFAQHSMFTYMDLLEASKRLGIQNQSVKDNLGDIADIAASSGKPLSQVAQLYDAVLAGGRVGLGLSARGGFAQYGLSTKEIFAAAGLPYKPGQNLQNAMTPRQLIDAVHKVLADTGRAGLNEKLATSTIVGATGMVKDAVTRVEIAVGSGRLPVVIDALNNTAKAINWIADSVKTNPMLGDRLVVYTALTLTAGAVMKGVAAYRQYQAILKTAAAVGATERAGEAAKVGIARSEAAAVDTATLAYKGEATAIKLTGEAAETSGTAAVVAAGKWGALTKVIGGISTVASAAAVALAALSLVNDATDALGDTGNSKFDAGYDVFRPDHAAGILDSMKHVARQGGFLANELKRGSKGTFQDWYNTGREIVNDSHFDAGNAAIKRLQPEMDALMKDWNKPGRAPKLEDVARRLHTIVENARKYAVTAGGILPPDPEKKTPDAAPVEKPDIPYQLEREIKLHQYMAEEIKLKHGSEKAYRKEIAAEVDDLLKAEKIMRRMAAAETDTKKKYADLNKADEFHHQAVAAKYAEDKKGSLFDKTIAKIIGGQGLSEDEILKRTGIGRKFFRSIKHDKLPPDPFKSAIKQLAQRPVVFKFQIGDKVLQELKTEFSDEVFRDLLKILEQSGNRPVLGGA